ncbi:MAG: hypothetical protein ACE5FI_18225, partial [Anaerolineales bacterium]
VWGGFYVAWEISARFLIVGVPLLAAPMAALLGGVGGWRRVMLWPLAAALALFSVVNALVVFVDPFVPYHRSPVAFYEEALRRPLRAYFPALGTRTIAAPDDGTPEWSAAAGQAQHLLHSERIGVLSIGWYKLYGQAQFGPSADPDTAALVFDVSSSEDGRSLLHAQISPADADDATGVADFALPYFNPYYNRWDFPFYLDIQTTGATDVRLSPILIEPDPAETNKRVGAWLAGIGLLVVLFAAPAGSWRPRFR